MTNGTNIILKKIVVTFKSGGKGWKSLVSGQGGIWSCTANFCKILKNGCKFGVNAQFYVASLRAQELKFFLSLGLSGSHKALFDSILKIKPKGEVVGCGGRRLVCENRMSLDENSCSEWISARGGVIYWVCRGGKDGDTDTGEAVGFLAVYTEEDKLYRSLCWTVPGPDCHTPQGH